MTCSSDDPPAPILPAASAKPSVLEGHLPGDNHVYDLWKEQGQSWTWNPSSLNNNPPVKISYGLMQVNVLAHPMYAPTVYRIQDPDFVELVQSLAVEAGIVLPVPA